MRSLSFLLNEGLRFALGALWVHPLRFLLSGFGVTVGIFCVLSIWTIVDLIRAELGDTLNSLSNPYRIYVDKFPWRMQHPGRYPWWKYIKRPYVSYKEYHYLSEHLTRTSGVAILTYVLSTSVQHESSRCAGSLRGVSYDFGEMEELLIREGRYFSYLESESGADVALIGHEVADELGITKHPIGAKIKLRGRTYTVIGVLEKQGESLFMPNKDEAIYIPFKSILKIARTKGRDALGTQIMIDGQEGGASLNELEAEVRSTIRARRALRPTEEDTFAINRAEMLYEFAELFLRMLKIVGSVMASFSIIVGGFNIANVMFISVQERTFQIGLQKALGARRAFILWQFLSEALILTLMGGLIGITLVYIATLPLTIEVTLSISNILWSLGICVVVGVIAGLFPAYRGARMHPIDALRANG